MLLIHVHVCITTNYTIVVFPGKHVLFLGIDYRVLLIISAVNEDEDELDCEGMMVTTIRKGTNSLEQRKKRKREKALVDAKLLYPPRKQTRFQETDGNELRWSSTTTCNTKHDSAPGLHQTATVSRRYNDILTLTSSSFPSNCDKQNSITKQTNKNISLTHLKSSDRWDKTTESSNQKWKCEKPSASSTVDVVQQNRQQVLKQHNQVDKINSKWEKFMVQDDPSIDEPETNSCESKKAEKENAIVGCSPFNDYQGCAMSCKDSSSSAMETIQRQCNRQLGSNSKHQIPGKSSLLQSEVAVDSPCKPTYDGIFQLDDEELEGNWWEV